MHASYDAPTALSSIHGESMAYKIDYLDSKGLIGSNLCNGTLIKAQAIAEKAIRDRIADAVEIRDERDNVVFRHPRKIARI